MKRGTIFILLFVILSSIAFAQNEEVQETAGITPDNYFLYSTDRSYELIEQIITVDSIAKVEISLERLKERLAELQTYHFEIGRWSKVSEDRKQELLEEMEIDMLDEIELFRRTVDHAYEVIADSDDLAYLAELEDDGEAIIAVALELLGKTTMTSAEESCVIDSICDIAGGETADNCHEDCLSVYQFLGEEYCVVNFICEPEYGEWSGNCPEDCGDQAILPEEVVCVADNICNVLEGEDLAMCPDCLDPNVLCWINSQCEAEYGENADNCPEDCFEEAAPIEDVCVADNICNVLEGEDLAMCPDCLDPDVFCWINGMCEAEYGEDSANCPEDCPEEPASEEDICQVNGVCEDSIAALVLGYDAGENAENCPADCLAADGFDPAICWKNDICEMEYGENYQNCQADCQAECIVNNICEAEWGENAQNCADDCSLQMPEPVPTGFTENQCEELMARTAAGEYVPLATYDQCEKLFGPYNPPLRGSVTTIDKILEENNDIALVTLLIETVLSIF